MPITKSAIKALRVSRRKTAINQLTKLRYRKAVKEMRLKPTPANLRKAYSTLDKAVKNHCIHKNKSGRLKKTLSKLIPKKRQK